MGLLVRPLGGSASAEQVLRRLSARAYREGLAPPAALTGEWFGRSAVLAPSVAVAPREDAFGTLDDLPRVEDTAGGVVGGGWIGYLGYGLTDPGMWSAPRVLPPAAWGWADHVLRRDSTGQWWFEALHDDERMRAVFATLEDIADDGGSPGTWTAGPVVTPDPDEHCKAVRSCIEEIAAGEIFQANICSRFSLPFEGDPLEVFAAGSESLRPARAAYVAGGWGAVASLSPELFLRRRGNEVHTSPIKGTLPRRGGQDDENARLLRESEKDVAENVMIVDMARNDLGRVALPGTVTVPKLLDVQPHPGVWHLVSDVHARVPESVTHAELLAAAFPPASITGTPKVRALELISELEARPRDVYCGTVGMVSPVAGLELNVAIRTLEYAAGTMHLGVGGGIVADSDPVAEWHECLTKAAPLLTLLRG